MFRIIKKTLILSTTSLFLSSLLLIGTGVRAQAVDVLNGSGGPCTNGSAQASSVCQDNQTGTTDNPIFGPNGIITTITQIVAIIVGVVAVIMIIISGLRMVLSNGDPAAVSSSRAALLVAIVGLAIAASAQLIVSFILSKIGTG